jgi:6-pyruvoyltetrahydropterin/6-carboxytetrahydropterin synthase
MVMDFGDLKALVNDCVLDDFDHAVVFHVTDPRAKLLEDAGKIVLASFQPTSENLILEFVGRLRKKLPSNVELHSVRLRETSSSFAEWFAADN